MDAAKKNSWKCVQPIVSGIKIDEAGDAGGGA